MFAIQAPDKCNSLQLRPLSNNSVSGEFRYLALTMQRYRIRRRISQLRFLDSALLQPVCEVGRRRIVALRDELLGGPVGKQRLDFRTVLVQLAFAGAFRPSDRQAGSPEARLARRASFVRAEINPRSISGRCRIRVKTGQKGFFGSHRIRFVMLPTRPRLVLFSIFPTFFFSPFPV